MNINKTLELRKNFPLGSKTTNINDVDYITTVFDSDEDIIGLVLPSFFLNRKIKDIKILKELIFDRWYLSGIYDLSSLWHPYTGIQFNLICFSLTKPKTIEISN